MFSSGGLKAENRVTPILFRDRTWKLDPQVYMWVFLCLLFRREHFRAIVLVSLKAWKSQFLVYCVYMLQHTTAWAKCLGAVIFISKWTRNSTFFVDRVCMVFRRTSTSEHRLTTLLLSERTRIAHVLVLHVCMFPGSTLAGKWLIAVMYVRKWTRNSSLLVYLFDMVLYLVRWAKSSYAVRSFSPRTDMWMWAMESSKMIC